MYVQRGGLRRLHLEPLEAKRLLAADIAVSIDEVVQDGPNSGTTLTLAGFKRLLDSFDDGS